MRKKELRERLDTAERRLTMAETHLANARKEIVHYLKALLAHWEKENGIYYDFDNGIVKVEKWYPVVDLYNKEKLLRRENALVRNYAPSMVMIDHRTLRIVDDWILVYKNTEQESELTSLKSKKEG